MTDTMFTELLGRMRVMLADEQARLFNEAKLTEGLRQALNEVALRIGIDCTLDGLDGAEVTSLPGGLQAVLVKGAAGFAAQMRAVERADAFGVPASQPADLADWAEQQVADFRSQLEAYAALTCQDGLHTSDQAPYADPGWPLEAEG